MALKVIYEPRGKAGEYAQLAVNLFTGCRHACEYCFAPLVLHKKAGEFHTKIEPRRNILKNLMLDAEELAGDPREILLCFTCDPYQGPVTCDTTRRALKILGTHNLKATVLTKGGSEAIRDFDIMQEFNFSFGTSLTFWKDVDRMEFEPLAATVGDRMEAIRIAKEKYGLKTWVSLEPVIDPAQALLVIKSLHSVVDHWKVGKINYNPDLENKVNWFEFYHNVTRLLDHYQADYYIKQSLKMYADDRKGLPYEINTK